MAGTLTKKRFTADEYHRMAQVGILCEDDRVELMDGEIIVMSPIGPRHMACVSRATHALVKAVGDDAIVQPQGSVRLDLYYEPEPELVLLRPRADFYSTRHGSPGCPPHDRGCRLLARVRPRRESPRLCRSAHSRVLDRGSQWQRGVALLCARARGLSTCRGVWPWPVDRPQTATDVRHSCRRLLD